MDFNEYQQAAAKTAIYPQRMSVVYPTLGLAGETGEVAEKVKKTFRDNEGNFDDTRREAIAAELGDVLWYLAMTARDLGYTFDEIAQMNVAKLASRKERAALHGSGDNR